MGRRDRRASGSHAAPSGAPAVDVLSDVLRAVRLSGALFFRVEAAAPWGLELPDGATLAPSILPRAPHIVSYHVVTRGACWAGIPGEAPVRLEAGDILVLPQGDAYFMATAARSPGAPDPEAILTFMRRMAAGQLPFTVVEGGRGRERLDLVCGFLGCDIRPFNPLLATLPRLLHVRPRAGPAGDGLAQLIALTLAESREPRPGSDCVRLRLSELIFVEVVRRHLATLPPEDTGWLAGLRDPIVGQALALLHERPAHGWTIGALARDVGRSRSVLAERFARLVGHPPMQYLARWRIQVAARLLAEEAAKVSAVAREVGYDSEAAFSRAFKKLAGLSPGAWRARRAGALPQRLSPARAVRRPRRRRVSRATAGGIEEWRRSAHR